MASQDPKAKPKPKLDKKSLVEIETDEVVEIETDEAVEIETDEADEADESVESQRKPFRVAERSATRNVGSIVIVPPRGRKARTIYL